jgi:hypothetical protein
MATFIPRRMRATAGPKVLLLVRDGIASTWQQLCGEFRLDADEFHTAHNMLWNEIKALVDCGLLEIANQADADWRPSPDAQLKLTPQWDRIQLALGISLTQLAELDPNDDLVVRPFFLRPTDDDGHRRDIFVAMPFSEHLRPVYEDHVCGVASSLGLTIARGDDFFSAESVVRDVWNAIYKCRLVVADCTARNANVFYELGLAHVLGRPVILISQDSSDVPFNVRHIRVIRYEYTPRGMAAFEQQLAKAIREILPQQGVSSEA